MLKWNECNAWNKATSAAGLQCGWCGCLLSSNCYLTKMRKWKISVHWQHIYYTWSVNKVRKLVAVNVLLPHCWIPPWSSSTYSPWEAMHRCQRLVHPSKQFWNWFCGMAFRAAVVLFLMSSMSSKCLPFNISFIFGNRKSQWGLEPVNKQNVPTQLFV